MTTVPTINEKLLKLKQEIKEWEYAFTKDNGSKPTQEDIKINTEIQHKYKKYNRYKKELKYQQEKENFLTTPTKQKAKADYVTPRKSEEPLAVSPFPMKEIGPTPQLQGRVLSIFDIPVNSPSDKGADETITSDAEVDAVLTPKADPVFKTPSKKRITFVSIRTPTTRTPTASSKRIQETPMYLRRTSSQISPVKPSSQEEIFKLGAEGAKSLIRTPQNSSVLLDFNVEPSPILSPIRKNVKRKSLFEMMKELSQIQDDVTKYEKDEEDLNKMILKENQEARDNQIEDEEWNLMNDENEKVVSEALGEDEDKRQDDKDLKGEVEGQKESKRNWKRAKTQKRSTKRRKIKPLQLDQLDQLLDVDLRDQMRKISENQQELLDRENEYSSDEDNANHNEMILNDLEDDEDDELSSSEEEEEETSEVNPVPQQEKFKLLNTNFVRMKIHYKNRGKFKRGRR